MSRGSSRVDASRELAVARRPIIVEHLYCLFETGKCKCLHGESEAVASCETRRTSHFKRVALACWLMVNIQETDCCFSALRIRQVVVNPTCRLQQFVCLSFTAAIT